MSVSLIPSVLSTNHENPLSFCAEALGVGLDELRAMIRRGLIEERSNGQSLSLRLSAEGRRQVRERQK
jgi:hypothetical protein